MRVRVKCYFRESATDGNNTGIKSSRKKFRGERQLYTGVFFCAHVQNNTNNTIIFLSAGFEKHNFTHNCGSGGIVGTREQNARANSHRHYRHRRHRHQITSQLILQILNSSDSKLCRWRVSPPTESGPYSSPPLWNHTTIFALVRPPVIRAQITPSVCIAAVVTTACACFKFHSTRKILGAVVKRSRRLTGCGPPLIILWTNRGFR